MQFWKYQNYWKLQKKICCVSYIILWYGQIAISVEKFPEFYIRSFPGFSGSGFFPEKNSARFCALSAHIHFVHFSQPSSCKCISWLTPSSDKNSLENSGLNYVYVNNKKIFSRIPFRSSLSTLTTIHVTLFQTGSLLLSNLVSNKIS